MHSVCTRVPFGPRSNFIKKFLSLRHQFVIRYKIILSVTVMLLVLGKCTEYPTAFLSLRVLKFWCNIFASACKCMFFICPLSFIGDWVGMVQWWGLTNVALVQFKDQASHMGWGCCCFSLFLKSFLFGSSGFPCSTKTNLPNSNSTWKQWRRRATSWNVC